MKNNERNKRVTQEQRTITDDRLLIWGQGHIISHGYTCLNKPTFAPPINWEGKLCNSTKYLEQAIKAIKFSWKRFNSSDGCKLSAIYLK